MNFPYFFFFCSHHNKRMFLVRSLWIIKEIIFLRKKQSRIWKSKTAGKPQFSPALYFHWLIYKDKSHFNGRKRIRLTCTQFPFFFLSASAQKVQIHLYLEAKKIMFIRHNDEKKFSMKMSKDKYISYQAHIFFLPTGDLKNRYPYKKFNI